jgi:hypothetical protein
MKIYFAFQCHNFQLRTCWMLSSILQQEIWPFKIIVDIACMPNNGIPNTTEQIAEYFSKNQMDVRLSLFTDKDIFARRGLIRNEQTKKFIDSNFDYIFFADADNVYPKNFFKRLIQDLKLIDKNFYTCIYSPAKMHTLKNETNDLINSTKIELPYIKESFARSLNLPKMEIPIELQKNGAAAGCMQVVSRKTIIDKCNEIYCSIKNKDRHMFNQKAWSDMHFRGRIGKSTRVRLPAYIHLQHNRDKEFKKHIEEQR